MPKSNDPGGYTINPRGRNTMSTTVAVEEAQAHLVELIDKLIPGQEVIITRNEQPIARLVGEPPRVRTPRQPGSAKGKILYMADDFDAPLEDFKEYME